MSAGAGLPTVGSAGPGQGRQQLVEELLGDSSTGVIGVTAEAEDDEGLAVSVAVQETILASLEVLD